MNIWTKKTNFDYSQKRINNLHLRFDKNTDAEIKRACTDFKNWLQKEYTFPVCIKIYIKNKEHIRTKDGDFVSATCFLPFEHHNLPYIKIAVGDYIPSLQQHSKDCQLAGILHSIAHELTHCYQWLKHVETSEKQAVRCADYIIKKYSNTRMHP